jgi:hypothetical protein
LDSASFALGAWPLRPSATRPSSVNQFVFFHGEILVFVGSFVKLDIFAEAIFVIFYGLILQNTRRYRTIRFSSI